jgi:hypothetical protein
MLVEALIEGVGIATISASNGDVEEAQPLLNQNWIMTFGKARITGTTLEKPALDTIFILSACAAALRLPKYWIEDKIR